MCVYFDQISVYCVSRDGCVMSCDGCVMSCDVSCHMLSWTTFGLADKNLLTLGAHAQRGLQWLVCVSVCLSMTILALQAMRRLMSDTNSFSATRAWKIMWRFCWNDCIREIWPIGIISTGLPRSGLARSAHRGQRGYVSKSSAALNPLTITQLACER